MKRATCSWLLLLPIAACATPPAVVEVVGFEAFAQRCANEPAPLSDQEALAYAEAVDAAVALPEPAARVAALKSTVLEPLIQRDQRLRACGLQDRQRADGLLALIARHNQIVRETR